MRHATATHASREPRETTTMPALSEFDLSDPTARLVAADALQESGDDAGAIGLRTGVAREEIHAHLLMRLGRMKGGATMERQRKLSTALAGLSLDQLRRAQFSTCSDEKTGSRFGAAKCRRGRCAKIGHRTFEYQLWLDWS